jgi:hypothetical protein
LRFRLSGTGQDRHFRRAAVALLQTPGITPAQRLHTLECIARRLPVPER